ncbi:WUSCHEL-related homeobox 11-like isoform X2 [Wolffia australiana]
MSSSEPERTRWSPKPEQILILESIFNSGMVNPTKTETVKIRSLLENYGPVGDANVFYWFQNRRSRSRRRQRLMQASMVSASANQSSAMTTASSTDNSPAGSGFSPVLLNGAGEDDVLLTSRPWPSFLDSVQHVSCEPLLYNSTCHYQPGFMTIFINGIPLDVPRGPFDVGDIFGPQFLLVHSSGEPVPMTELGIVFQGLHAGENYFLWHRGVDLGDVLSKALAGVHGGANLSPYRVAFSCHFRRLYLHRFRIAGKTHVERARTTRGELWEDGLGGK